MPAVVSQLFVYPIKSCAGIALELAELSERGIKHDREWMVTDPSGHFLTQRELPKMSLVQSNLEEKNGSTTLSLSAQGMTPYSVPALDQLMLRSALSEVQVWNDLVNGIDCGDEAAQWLSDFLGRPCRLVQMPPTTLRRVDRLSAQPGFNKVGFADQFPFLLTTEESLCELNKRLDEPVPMSRFRPNIVVKGVDSPFAEDSWQTIKIGAVAFNLPKGCARCTIITVDQQTGKRGVEPLRELSKFRNFNNQVIFGQNLAHLGLGLISLGETLQVLGSS